MGREKERQKGAYSMKHTEKATHFEKKKLTHAVLPIVLPVKEEGSLVSCLMHTVCTLLYQDTACKKMLALLYQGSSYKEEAGTL